MLALMFHNILKNPVIHNSRCAHALEILVDVIYIFRISYPYQITIMLYAILDQLQIIYINKYILQMLQIKTGMISLLLNLGEYNCISL
jgi:hypothetical protein